MPDERPGGGDKMRKARIENLRAIEYLPRGVDVHPGNLHEAMRFAKSFDARQLRRRVARGHIGDGAEAQFAQAAHQLVEEFVLKLLRLFIPGRRFSHVAQVGVSGDSADLLTQRDDFTHVAAFRMVGMDKEGIGIVGFQHPEQIVQIMRILRVEQIAAHACRRARCPAALPGTATSVAPLP